MNKKLILLSIMGLLLMAAGITVAICFGSKTIPFEVVYKSIFHYDKSMDMMLIRDARIPRALCSILIGGMLAMGGGVMQGITRNPIAEPSVLGITQGATLAVAAFSVFGMAGGGAGRSVAALIGAFVSGFLILFFGMKNASNMSLSRLLLAGTAFSTFFLSLASTIALLGNRSQELAFWVAGGLGNTTWQDVQLLLSVGGIASILCLCLSQKINIINLGEETAVGLGVNPYRIRLIAVSLLVLICAVCVSVSGNIVFVGLIVPHVVRKVVGADYRKVMPLSFLWGGVLLVWADVAAKMANIPYETPISLFTAFLGIPVFLILVRKEQG